MILRIVASVLFINYDNGQPFSSQCFHQNTSNLLHTILFRPHIWLVLDIYLLQPHALYKLSFRALLADYATPEFSINAASRASSNNNAFFHDNTSNLLHSNSFYICRLPAYTPCEYQTLHIHYTQLIMSSASFDSSNDNAFF